MKDERLNIAVARDELKAMGLSHEEVSAINIALNGLEALFLAGKLSNEDVAAVLNGIKNAEDAKKFAHVLSRYVGQDTNPQGIVKSIEEVKDIMKNTVITEE